MPSGSLTAPATRRLGMLRTYEREVRRYRESVDEINALEKEMKALSNDQLRAKTEEFKKRGGDAICVAIVGVNHATTCTSYEGDRAFPTDGRRYKHPVQEAQEAIVRLKQQAGPSFNEFVILKFAASNAEPFPFAWTDEPSTVQEYSASLIRISREYDRRFP